MYKKLTATLFKKAVPARYDHINFTPPKGVREEAKRGLKLRREHKRGGLSTQQASKHGIGSGVQRATNLASGASVSPRTVRRMRAFFARHSAYKEHHKDKTSASYISWLLWGGDAGERWANKVYAQMERADDEMKKAGGEQAGHKYIRRIPVARRGKMGYRYIYRRDKERRKELRRKDGEQETKDTQVPSNDVALTGGQLDRLETLSQQAYEEAGDSFADMAPMSREALRDFSANLTPEQVSAVTSYTPEPDFAFAPFPELDPSDENYEWVNSLSQGMNEAPQIHTPTFESMSTAPVEFNDTPIEGAPTEEMMLFIDALGETEGLAPIKDAVDNTTSVDGDKLRLPLKDIGKATALSLLLLATESYRTLTTNDPNAVSVAEVEGFSKRELNKMDREAVQEAKAKIRDSLNKDREEARAKKEEHKKAEREIKEKIRNEAREKKEEKRAQEKQQREETKRQREEERAQEKQQREEKRAQEKQQRERDRAEKERLKQTQREQREQEKKEDTARKEEEAKKQVEKEFEFRREERELAQQAKEEAQIRKEERAEKRRLARKKAPKKVPKKQAKKALSSATDEQAVPRRVRRTKLRKSLVTMYTGRGSDETTS